MKSIRNYLSAILSASAMTFAACDASIDTGSKDGEFGPSLDAQQQAALVSLQGLAGGPISVELSEQGGIRVLNMTPGHNLISSVGAPDDIASDFISQHSALFRLESGSASEFEATRVDVDNTGLRHVTMQRTIDGIPVFQGAITVHMDASNSIFSVLGDDNYLVRRPINQMATTPASAITAAASAFGLSVNPQLTEQDGLKSTFSDASALDLAAEPRVFHVGPNDDRFVHQVLLSWKDSDNQLQYQLVLVDATTNEVLFNYDLVNTYSGKVWTKYPTSTTDQRVNADFPAAWVGSARKTSGNNVNAATDLNANNSVDASEIQPTADANGVFNASWGAASQNFKEASVISLFYHNNLFHDHLYDLGFTESSGNFQVDNLGRGGSGNDAVQADAQDGSGTDNANFATPPDGSKPRMQMYLFTINGGNQEDSDFDAGIIYHEYSHGLSNRLIGGGSTGCLGGTQSGGMGEGWGDFMGASFLNDPVVGAYVTGDFNRGIRSAPLNNNPATYAQIKNGSMAEVHDAGEIWASTLWKVRDAIGANASERLVVAGMKLTPCNPTMLQARDAILQADANLNGGANKCVIWSAFASKQMGFGASSPNHNSTSAIVLSTTVPAECGGTPPPPPPSGNTQSFTSTDANKAIPDNNATGVTSTITVPAGLGKVLAAKVDVNITHSYQGDLKVTLTGPDGKSTVLWANQGGSADNVILTATDISSAFANGVASGLWSLKVVDNAAQDTGIVNSFKLTLTTESTGGTGGTAGFQGSATVNTAIPDNSTTGISSSINANTSGIQVQTVQVKLNITHTWRGDLVINLTSPAGETRAVATFSSSDSADNVNQTFDVTGFTAGSNGSGNWTLTVSDKAAQDTGSLNTWSLGVNKTAP